jgi:hypothetical protein
MTYGYTFIEWQNKQHNQYKNMSLHIYTFLCSCMNNSEPVMTFQAAFFRA